MPQTTARRRERSAADGGVLQLVEVGPVGDGIDDAVDGGDGELAVALRPGHHPDERGPAVGDEGGDAEDVMLGHAPLVLLAEGPEGATLVDGLPDQSSVGAVLLEDGGEHVALTNVATLVVAGPEQGAVGGQEPFGPNVRHGDADFHGEQAVTGAEVVPNVGATLLDVGLVERK